MTSCDIAKAGIHSTNMSEKDPNSENIADNHTNSLARGAEIISGYVKSLPVTAGVYRMIAQNGDVLYVGKAKALKKRVVSYTQVDKLSIRLQRMVALTHSMEFVHTHTEAEALLLEANLIKKLKPRYNILLRDDKSFPYILIRGDHDYPQIKKHRGAKKNKNAKGGGEYFGPYASASAVNHTIDLLHRVFRLRNCSDSDFATRERPCLQYHIKRCSAPCVGYVTQDEYKDQVNQAREFLCGKSRAVQENFAEKMQAASEREDFEKAAEYRDRIKALAVIQSSQDINVENIGDVDVIALTQKEGRSCVQVFFFRGGQNLGNRPYFPRHEAEADTAEILATFMGQFYVQKPVPSLILTNIEPLEKGLLEEALTTQKGTAKVTISKPERGQRRRLIEFVENNAKDALERHLIERAGEVRHLSAVAELFGMDEVPKRIEVYDNSHISGTNMVGGMIVAGIEGFRKAAYRKFNIRDAKEADDYGMMREVMLRRFGRAIRENVDTESDDWPDSVIDRRWGGAIKFCESGIGRPKYLGQINGCRDCQGGKTVMPDGSSSLWMDGRRSNCLLGIRHCIICNACGTRCIDSPSGRTARAARTTFPNRHSIKSRVLAPSVKRLCFCISGLPRLWRAQEFKI